MAARRPDLSPSDVPLTTAPPPRSPVGDRFSFWSLIVLTFQQAFTATLCRLLLVLSVLGGAAASESWWPAVAIAAFLFPWLVMVGPAGWLADRCSRTAVVRGLRWLQLGAIVLAGVALATGSPAIAVGAILLLAVETALLSPSKYCLLPELLPEARLGWAMGVLQGFLFLALVMATALAPLFHEFLFSGAEARPWLGAALLAAQAGLGLLLAWLIRPVPAADPEAPREINPAAAVASGWKEIAASPGMSWGVAGLVTWWLAAAMTKESAAMLCRHSLALTPFEAAMAMIRSASAPWPGVSWQVGFPASAWNWASFRWVPSARSCSPFLPGG